MEKTWEVAVQKILKTTAKRTTKSRDQLLKERQKLIGVDYVAILFRRKSHHKQKSSRNHHAMQSFRFFFHKGGVWAILGAPPPLHWVPVCFPSAQSKLHGLFTFNAAPVSNSPKYTIFGESDKHPLTFLKRPSNISKCIRAFDFTRASHSPIHYN